VTCVDKDRKRVTDLIDGIIPIFEPGLEQIVVENVGQARLSFTTDLKEAVQEADAIFIAVGTPSRRGDGHADLSYVFAAAEEIAQSLSGFTVIVTKSTVPVGTGDSIDQIIRETRPDADYCVVSNPEFLREGAAVSDFKRPDRIVVGTDDSRGREVMTEVYRPLYLNQSPILFTSRRTAELTKYAANAFLATKIAFINEMADLCEKVGADVQDVSRGIGLDNRIGSKFLHAGPGYGGSCFPKDTLALVKTAQDFGSPVHIVEAVASINSTRKRMMANKVIHACGGSVRDKTISILGLAFKPNTDDMRDSPAIDIINALQAAGAKIQAFDPASMDQAKAILSDVQYHANAYDCIEQTDALVIVTEWDAFRALDLDRVKASLKTPVVVDLRNIYRPDIMQSKGFAYSSIGRI
jgi:UDPglucose 6-dehydrogenase